MDALGIAAHAVIIGLVDPENLSVFGDQNRSGDRHTLEPAWKAHRDPQEIPCFEFEGFVMFESQSTDIPHFWITEQLDKLQIVALLVGLDIEEIVLAQRKDHDAVRFKKRLHFFKPPQLGGTIRSPVASKELEQKALALPILGIVYLSVGIGHLEDGKRLVDVQFDRLIGERRLT